MPPGSRYFLPIDRLSADEKAVVTQPSLDANSDDQSFDVNRDPRSVSVTNESGTPWSLTAQPIITSASPARPNPSAKSVQGHRRRPDFLGRSNWLQCGRFQSHTYYPFRDNSLLIYIWSFEYRRLRHLHPHLASSCTLIHSRRANSSAELQSFPEGWGNYFRNSHLPCSLRRTSYRILNLHSSHLNYPAGRNHSIHSSRTCIAEKTYWAGHIQRDFNLPQAGHL